MAENNTEVTKVAINDIGTEEDFSVVLCHVNIWFLIVDG